MKTLPLQVILVCNLMGLLLGDLQVFGFTRQRGNVLPIQQFTSDELLFDMALKSFDDQYEGCVEEMEKKATELWQPEMARNINYTKAWQNATLKWKVLKGSIPVPKGLKDDYAIGLLAYTLETDLYKDLNVAVREAGQSKEFYLKEFHFKAMHFLLTRAIQVLHDNNQTKCHDAYRGVSKTRFIAKPSDEARFGQFASSSLQLEISQGFGRDTFFTIKTCHGAFIDKISFFPREAEVLIPPFEKFRVVNFITSPEGNNIKLTSTGKYSKYNCVLVKGSSLSHFSAKAQTPPFLLWGFLLMAGALGAPGLL